MPRARPSRSDTHLSNYWNALVRNAPTEELARLAQLVEPSEIAAIERVQSAHQRYAPNPEFALRLEKILMDTSISPIAGTLPQPHVSPPFANGGRARRVPLAPTSQRSRRLVPAFSIGLVILLILASLGGIWLFNDRHDTSRVLAPASATPSPEASPDVPMYRGNPARTGVFPGPGINGTPVELWHASVPGQIQSAPAIVDSVMYFGAGDGSVYALDIATGETVWSFAGTSAIQSSPAVSNGMVYVGSEDGTLYALASGDGSKVWSFPGASAHVAPLIVEGTLYTGGSDGFMYALDPASGAQRWRSPLSASASRSPSVVDGVVFMGSTDGVLHTFDAENGKPGWSVKLEGGNLATTAVSDGVVYQNTFNGDVNQNHVYALDAATGKELWRFQIPDSDLGYLPPAVGETLVYIPGLDGNVYALDRASGTVVWQFATSDQVTAAPALVGDTLYVGGEDHNLYALDATTGSEQWRFAVDGGINFGPVISGGVAYTGTGFGTMYAIGSSDMLPARTRKTPEASAVASQVPSTPVTSRESDIDLHLLWETTGDPDQPLTISTNLNIAPDGNLWVSDGSHSQFQIFSPDGAFLESWGGSGYGPNEGQFNFIRPASNGDAFGAVAFAPDGTFYVADTGNHRIQHFTADRTFLNAWGSFGAEDSQFVSPMDVAVDPDGLVYVGDDRRGDLQVFEADGTFLRVFGGHGDPEFQNLLTLEPDGTIWGADGKKSLLHQWTLEGELLRTIPVSTSDGTPVVVGDVAFDDTGNMLVPGGYERVILLLDPKGVRLAEWDLDNQGDYVTIISPILDEEGNLYLVSDGGVLSKYQLTKAPVATPAN